MQDIKEFEKQLKSAIEFLESELRQIRTGRASAELVESIQVEAYGSSMPLKSLANISVTDVKALAIEPWDKTLVEAISKAISMSDLGLSPSIDGNIVRVTIPDMTEERRKSFAKVVAEKAEASRQAIRQIRHKFMKDVDQDVKDGMSEDVGKRLKDEAEKLVKEYNKKVEELKDRKVEDIMTI